MPLARFDPPGLLEDFDDQQKAEWSAFINEQFQQAVSGYPDKYEFDGPREQFFNPLTVDPDTDAQKLAITWVAFPRQVTVTTVGDVQRWRKADSSRDLQDEYCEWSVERDPHSDKIRKVTFTCEGPEYWAYLANTRPDLAVALYSAFVSDKVQQQDLFSADGRYNPRNKWNATTVDGAMHLIQRNNTLSAEIELAAGSTVVRVIDGELLTGEQELIRCGEYGAPERHSDPHIGERVNSLTRRKADVTLENPVGLYFAGLSTAGWRTQDGSDPAKYWHYVRGTDDMPVRAVYEVPPDRGFVVGDIEINGRTIDFAGQIEDFINMKLTGIATRFGKSQVQPMTGCRRPRPARAADTEAAVARPPSVQEFLDPEWIAGRFRQS
jgi:hypothetical protein